MQVRIVLGIISRGRCGIRTMAAKQTRQPRSRRRRLANGPPVMPHVLRIGKLALVFAPNAVQRSQRAPLLRVLLESFAGNQFVIGTRRTGAQAALKCMHCRKPQHAPACDTHGKRCPLHVSPVAHGTLSRTNGTKDTTQCDCCNRIECRAAFSRPVVNCSICSLTVAPLYCTRGVLSQSVRVRRVVGLVGFCRRASHPIAGRGGALRVQRSDARARGDDMSGQWRPRQRNYDAERKAGVLVGTDSRAMHPLLVEEKAMKTMTVRTLGGDVSPAK